MMAFDTNLAVYAANSSMPEHAAARSFLDSLGPRDDVVVCARLALTLRHHGVTEFATANPRDFQGFGFTRVWNPLTH
jgi:predicted nucleic acid-binding protein